MGCGSIPLFLKILESMLRWQGVSLEEIIMKIDVREYMLVISIEIRLCVIENQWFPSLCMQYIFWSKQFYDIAAIINNIF